MDEGRVDAVVVGVGLVGMVAGLVKIGFFVVGAGVGLLVDGGLFAMGRGGSGTNPVGIFDAADTTKHIAQITKVLMILL